MPEIRITVSETMDKFLESLVWAGLGSTKAEVARLAVAQMLLSMPDVLKKDASSKGPDLGFSSEGRLLQVEYAGEATRRGTSIVGVVAVDGVVLVKQLPAFGAFTLRFVPAIINNPSSHVRPIRHLSEAVAVGFTGIAADCQSVLRKASEQLGIGSDGESNAADVYQVGDAIASIMHAHTLDRNSRILGASFIVAGLDPQGAPRLLIIDPSGGLWDQKIAKSGGELSRETYDTLVDAVDGKSLTLDEAVKAAMRASLQDGAGPQDLMVDVLDVKTKTFRELGLDEKRRYM